MRPNSLMVYIYCSWLSKTLSFFINMTFLFQAKAGFALNIAGICVATLATMTWGAALFKFDQFHYNASTVIDYNNTLNYTNMLNYSTSMP